jgi:hypothetical protein
MRPSVVGKQVLLKESTLLFMCGLASHNQNAIDSLREIHANGYAIDSPRIISEKTMHVAQVNKSKANGSRTELFPSMLKRGRGSDTFNNMQSMRGPDDRIALSILDYLGIDWECYVIAHLLLNVNRVALFTHNTINTDQPYTVQICSNRLVNTLMLNMGREVGEVIKVVDEMSEIVSGAGGDSEGATVLMNARFAQIGKAHWGEGFSLALKRATHQKG